jgi:hypothetical protein
MPVNQAFPPLCPEKLLLPPPPLRKKRVSSPHLLSQDIDSRCITEKCFHRKAYFTEQKTAQIYGFLRVFAHKKGQKKPPDNESRQKGGVRQQSDSPKESFIA